MRTHMLSVESLSLDPANVRQRTHSNLEAIKSSLRRFGQQKPIVVDSNDVVRAGNGTLEAAKAIGWKEIAVVRTDLADAEATAFAIADNRTAELAVWDDEGLAMQLRALHESVADGSLLTDLGFDESYLERLQDDVASVEPD